MNDRHLEAGMYYSRAEAENAIEELERLGYSPSDISVMMADKTRERDFAEHTGTKAAEGTATGAAIGGAIGAVWAGLTATGSIVAVAGTGGLAAPFVAGPLVAALAGLGAGGVVGGVVGALVGAGIPEDRAREYESGLGRGGILVGVYPHPGDQDRVHRVLHGAARV